ncbi:uncharacterized protein LOC125494189 [Beta vulgaris subsp. vulgaris]|uniref:uncharacterized protein LOC125494189 n=1 Tax=Beta vulgaris subsp. vulgaris TaxID=3555 RepID=UPI00254775A0|nr:uncharacterized protein LOC125494189 [Beta vulgaris subsp. vulgaris]
MAPPTAMIAAAPTIGGLTIILFSEHRFVFITTASFLLALVWKGISTYLGAAPIVRCLELHEPNVIITSRVADAALFLGPMMLVELKVYELGWNWDDLEQLAQGTLAGHLLECGGQLTGGFFMHPGDKHRDISFQCLLNLPLPYAEISYQGEICVAKVDGSGGVLNFGTCAQQLLYEITDPSAYITPDMLCWLF